MVANRSVAYVSQMRLRKLPRDRRVITFLGRYPTLRNTVDNYDRSKDCVGSVSVARIYNAATTRTWKRDDVPLCGDRIAPSTRQGVVRKLLFIYL